MISQGSLNRWLLGQASMWLPFLGLTAWRILGAGSLPAWVLWLAWSAMGLSFAGLWWVLQAGKTRADHATLLRVAGLLVTVAVYMRVGEVTWGIWAALVLVALGDLVDGWLARRYGGSDEGAILDMEADQLNLVALALLAALAGAGIWTFAVPGVRYAFVLSMKVLGIPFHDPKPCDGDNRRGKIICAVVMGLLICALLPVAPGWARVACGLSAALLLCGSYAGDVSFLLQRRRAASRSS